MRFRTCILLLFAAGLLSACNVAISDHPMFSDAQRSSDFRFEDGLWTRLNDDCSVDRSKSKEDWPECAGWVVISDNQAVRGSDKKADEPPDDIFIAEGDPPILQAKVRINGEESETYFFAVIKPVAKSQSGRITAVEAWAVACGIDKAKSGSPPDIDPYPGFDKDCQPDSIESLRAAALKSPTDEKGRWEWVRFEPR